MSSKSSVVRMFVALALGLSACTDTADDAASSTISTATTPATQPAESVTSPTNATDTETTANTSSTTESAPVLSDGCPATEAEPGAVTGVFEFVNMREEPTVDSPVLAELAAGSDLSFFPDSFVSEDPGRSWVSVQSGAESCGWVAAEYVKDADGRLVGFIDGVTYVQRALYNLGAEASHATYTQDGAEAPEVAFDDSELDPAIAELRQIGRTNPNARVRPDESVEPLEGSNDPVGCIFGDGLFCQVEVLNGDGEVIVVVGIGWYGDGISLLDLKPPA